MRISETLARLAAGRNLPATDFAAPGRLAPFVDFGSNPGALLGWAYVPDDLPRGAPLVVVLHGCTQNAAGYDCGTGWSELADRAGFALLFPEQRRANNPNLCFNWYESADIARHGGEAESIAQMTEAMVARHGLDRSRVFVTGLSAGGAMTAVMLATRPDLFAGGAIIGGLPYGCAQGVPAALERMAGRGSASGQGATVAKAFAHSGRRPSVSIWHGSADHTVVVANMDALSAQWREVHGVGDAPSRTEEGRNWQHREWREGDRIVVETWRIAGMGHGVPIDPAAPHHLGSAGPFMLPVGIDSTATIAGSWGLTGSDGIETKRTARPGSREADARATPAESARPPAPIAVRTPRPSTERPAAVQAIIENALRSAGLMK